MEQAATLVIRHRILRADHPRYEAWLNRIVPAAAEYKGHQGSQFWFTPVRGDAPQPPAWKQFLVTLAVIFPSTHLVPWGWHRLLPSLEGTLLGHLLVDATIVALVVYLWMPLITCWLASWLTPTD